MCNKKGDKDMNAAVSNNVSLSNFIKKKKQSIYDLARKNTKYNTKGQPVISRDDNWFNEDEWDDHYNNMEDK